MIKIILDFKKSLTYAFNGLKETFKERNFKIQITISILVIIIGITVNYNFIEWILVILCIGIVLTAETINTAIEEICDRLRDDLGISYKGTEKARDISAGAVLILASTSMLIFFIVMINKLF